MNAAVLICQLGLVLSLCSELLGVYGKVRWKEDECRRMLREAKGQSVQSPTPPKLSGHWTSYRCETRPGPEFVLRKYIFRRNSFHAQLYYYADEYCSDVTHSIIAKGFVRPMRASWRTPGGYEGKYRVSQIHVIPYTVEKAESFEKLSRRFCKRTKVTSVKLYKKFKVLQFTKYSKTNKDVVASDFDCSKLFNFTMNELQLLRIEKRQREGVFHRNHVIRKVKGYTETELYLGDVSTSTKHRQQYRPTYFQTALKKSKTPLCDVCSKIAKSNQWYPPVLPRRHVTTTVLEGDWVSDRCEARPNGQYLTRHLTFFPGGKSWQGRYEFYTDPVCNEPSFTLDVKGGYITGKGSDVIKSAREFVFRTVRLKITPKNLKMVQYLNHYTGNECGKSGTWKIGVKQDVTSTSGCETLGISLPNVEYELIKTEYVDRTGYLYVGQRPSDYVSMSERRNRPTSFQRPLVMCGDRSSGVNDVISDHYVMPSYSASAVALVSETNLPTQAGNTGVLHTVKHYIIVYVILMSGVLSTL